MNIEKSSHFSKIRERDLHIAILSFANDRITLIMTLSHLPLTTKTVLINFFNSKTGSITERYICRTFVFNYIYIYIY
jgi:hypothetical protein